MDNFSIKNAIPFMSEKKNREQMIYLFPFRFWPNGVLKKLERKQNSKSGPIISFEKRKARALSLELLGLQPVTSFWNLYH